VNESSEFKVPSSEGRPSELGTLNSELRQPPQRVRLTFSRLGEQKYLSHLDLARMWARAMRRAELPLAYSAGFSPRPRISFAQALPTGTTTEADLMDIVLDRPLAPDEVMARLNAQLPPNARVLKAEEVAYNAPSVESQLASATYELRVEGAEDEAAVRQAVAELLAHPSIPRVREREGRRREYDLRPLIAGLEVLDCAGGSGRLRLTLANGESLSARPDEVVEALGLRLVPGSVHRTALSLRPGSAGAEPAGSIAMRLQRDEEENGRSNVE